MLRGFTDPSWATRTTWAHTEWLASASRSTTFVKGIVGSIAGNSVTLADGTSLPYDYLVLARTHPRVLPAHTFRPRFLPRMPRATPAIARNLPRCLATRTRAALRHQPPGC